MKKLILLILMTSLTSLIYSSGQYRGNSSNGIYYDDNGDSYTFRTCDTTADIYGLSESQNESLKFNSPTSIYGSNGYEGQIRYDSCGGFNLID